MAPDVTATSSGRTVNHPSVHREDQYLSTGAPYDVRFDSNASNSISLADVLRDIGVINLSCKP